MEVMENACLALQTITVSTNQENDPIIALKIKGTVRPKQ